MISANLKTPIMKMVPSRQLGGSGERDREYEGCENKAPLQACPQVEDKMAVTTGREERAPTQPEQVSVAIKLPSSGKRNKLQ